RPTTEIYTLSLHDALPILRPFRRSTIISHCFVLAWWQARTKKLGQSFSIARYTAATAAVQCSRLKKKALGGSLGSSELCLSLFRSEEHTSELQSRFDLVCR